MMHIKTNDVSIQITGPDPDGHYWLGLACAGESCWIDLGRPTKMIETALLMAASVKFRPSESPTDGGSNG